MKLMRSLLCGLFVLFTFTISSVGLGQVKTPQFSDYVTIQSINVCWTPKGSFVKYLAEVKLKTKKRVEIFSVFAIFPRGDEYDRKEFTPFMEDGSLAGFGDNYTPAGKVVTWNFTSASHEKKIPVKDLVEIRIYLLKEKSYGKNSQETYFANVKVNKRCS